MVLVVAIVATAIAMITVAAVGFALATLGATFSLLDALFDGMIVVLILEGVAGFLVVALVVGFVLRPIASTYAKVGRGEPLEKGWVRVGGAACVALGLAFPVLFLSVFFSTTTFPLLAGAFVGVTASPFLLLSGVSLVRAREPAVW